MLLRLDGNNRPVDLQQLSLPRMRHLSHRIRCIAGLLLVAGLHAYSSPQNLLRNGSFEKADGPLPAQWTTETWQDKGDNVKFAIDTSNAYDGKNSVRIDNLAAEDAKLIQKVRVEPRSVYRLSAHIKVDSVGPDHRGACISVLGIIESSDDIRATHGRWVQTEVYGRTGPKQHELSVCGRLGFYGNTNYGRAWFDDMRLEKLGHAPIGAHVMDFYHEETPATPASTGLKTSLWPWIWSSAIAYLLLALTAWLAVFRAGFFEKFSPGMIWTIFGVGLGLSMVLRFVLGYTMDGVGCDISCFKAWAIAAADKGLPGFYCTDMFVDYPPGYIYVLYAVGLLRKLLSLSWDSREFLLLVKLPAMLADAVCAWVLLRLARKEMSLPKAGALSLLYALNPAVILDSAVWGQVDAFLALPVLLALLFMGKKNYAAASAFFIVACLIKPQGLLLAPLGVFALIRERDLRQTLMAIATAVGLAIVLLVPFSIRQDPLWIVRLYTKTLGSYPFATLNAPNLWALVAGNWGSLSTHFLGLSYEKWGTVALGAIVLAGAYGGLRGKMTADLWYGLAFFTVTAVYVLSVKMHERYLFPALLLAAGTFALSKSTPILVLFVGYSLSLFVDNAMVYDFVARNGNFSIAANDPVLVGLSWVNLGLFVWMGVVLYRRYLGGAPHPEKT